MIGEMSDSGAIDTAVAGAGAVVSALGPSLDRKATGTPLVAGTGHIVAAMQRHGVRRYIGLDWTIIRFIAPKNTAKQPKVRVGFFGTDKLGFAVSRADIAAFTAGQVDDSTYLRRAPAISN